MFILTKNRPSFVFVMGGGSEIDDALNGLLKAFDDLCLAKNLGTEDKKALIDAFYIKKTTEPESQKEDVLIKISEIEHTKAACFKFTRELASYIKTVRCIHRMKSLDRVEEYVFNAEFINAMFNNRNKRTFNIGSIPCSKCHRMNRMVHLLKLNDEYAKEKDQNKRKDILARTHMTIVGDCKNC